MLTSLSRLLVLHSQRSSWRRMDVLCTYNTNLPTWSNAIAHTWLPWKPQTTASLIMFTMLPTCTWPSSTPQDPRQNYSRWWRLCLLHQPLPRLSHETFHCFCFPGNWDPPWLFICLAVWNCWLHHHIEVGWMNLCFVNKQIPSWTILNWLKKIVCCRNYYFFELFCEIYCLMSYLVSVGQIHTELARFE